MSRDIFLDSSSGFSRASVFFAFLLSGIFLVFHMCRCLLTCLSLVFSRFAVLLLILLSFLSFVSELMAFFSSLKMLFWGSFAELSICNIVP